MSLNDNIAISSLMKQLAKELHVDDYTGAGIKLVRNDQEYGINFYPPEGFTAPFRMGITVYAPARFEVKTTVNHQTPQFFMMNRTFGDLFREYLHLETHFKTGVRDFDREFVLFIEDKEWSTACFRNSEVQVSLSEIVGSGFNRIAMNGKDLIVCKILSDFDDCPSAAEVENTVMCMIDLVLQMPEYYPLLKDDREVSSDYRLKAMYREIQKIAEERHFDWRRDWLGFLFLIVLVLFVVYTFFQLISLLDF